MLRKKFWFYAVLCLGFSAAGTLVLFAAVAEGLVGSRALVPLGVCSVLLVFAAGFHRAARKHRRVL